MFLFAFSSPFSHFFFFITPGLQSLRHQFPRERSPGPRREHGSGRERQHFVEGVPEGRRVGSAVGEGTAHCALRQFSNASGITLKGGDKTPERSCSMESKRQDGSCFVSKTNLKTVACLQKNKEYVLLLKDGRTVCFDTFRSAAPAVSPASLRFSFPAA